MLLGQEVLFNQSMWFQNLLQRSKIYEAQRPRPEVPVGSTTDDSSMAPPIVAPLEARCPSKLARPQRAEGASPMHHFIYLDESPNYSKSLSTRVIQVASIIHKSVVLASPQRTSALPKAIEVANPTRERQVWIVGG